MQRYDIEMIGGWNVDYKMSKDLDGDWVRFEDAGAAVAAERERCRQILLAEAAILRAQHAPVFALTVEELARKIQDGSTSPSTTSLGD